MYRDGTDEVIRQFKASCVGQYTSRYNSPRLSPMNRCHQGNRKRRTRLAVFFLPLILVLCLQRIVPQCSPCSQRGGRGECYLLPGFGEAIQPSNAECNCLGANVHSQAFLGGHLHRRHHFRRREGRNRSIQDSVMFEQQESLMKYN